MDWNKFEEQWNVYAGSAHAHWSKLTDQDWQAVTGKKEQLVGRIKERYGVSDVDAAKQVDDWGGSLVSLTEVSAKRR
jgi:uncharacterized protein YjbJ (UPF0337 family)